MIAFREGAMEELIVDGHTGYLVNDEREMADAICHLPRIDTRDCRTWAQQHYDGDVVAEAYESAYRSVMVAEPEMELLANV